MTMADLIEQVLETVGGIKAACSNGAFLNPENDTERPETLPVSVLFRVLEEVGPVIHKGSLYEALSESTDYQAAEIRVTKGIENASDVEVGYGWCEECQS